MNEDDDILDSLFSDGPVGELVNPVRPGQPTKYRDVFCKILPRYASAAGDTFTATNGEIADFFDVDIRTVENWLSEHPEFFRSVTAVKDKIDDYVQNALAKRALGFTVPEQKATFSDGQWHTLTQDKYYPPDVKACTHWLMVRRREQWAEPDKNVNLNVNLNLPDRLSLAKQRARDALPKPVTGERTFDQDDSD